MNPEKGLFYGLDDIGSEIFRMLGAPTRVSEVCAQLSVKYGADPAVVQRDLLNLFDAMAEHGLVVVTRESTPEG